MAERGMLVRLIALEEEVEALRTVVQAVLFGEAVHAESAGRVTLAELTGSLDYDDYTAKTEDPGNARRRRIIDRAHEILEQARPSAPGDESDEG